VASEPAVPADPVGATLGRYRLERELGVGAMGVVHAAFDPDLHRRIALKVLRGANVAPNARERLLREARAMARLTHPNVVTVYEVGTANGRDFVAMELVSGETLAEWLRATRRPLAAILDAFLAAGRGLAAAHAAGIVHRDFKPHNVLRSQGGRIAVTDFGLARASDDAPSPAPDASAPAGGEPGSPSALAGFTATGSLLGTPAYMAPEQWRGGAVTAATDQFAYCVALWEALAGQRPYRGPTLADLRSQVERGPAALDASRIPRQIRGLLLRGLDPDPAARWPSMDALLARLARARKTPGHALALACGALAASAALAFALRSDDARAPACEPPARDPATVWSPAIATDLRARTSDAHAAVLDAAYREWQTARTQACTAPPQVRQAQLLCLDGVLARFDALRQSFSRVGDSLAEDLQANLVDPAVCRKPAATDVPRLTLAPTPPVIAAYALQGRSQTEHKPSDVDLLALAGASNPDPCARVIATLAYDTKATDLPRARSLTADAAGAADECGDERLRADLRIQDSWYHWELPMIGPKGEAAIEQARIAAAHVMQPEIHAALAMQRLVVARQRGQWDDAFRWAEAAVADYRARDLPVRQVRAVIARNGLRLERSQPDDLEAIASDVRTWRPRAVTSRQADLVRKLDIQDATARFWLGEVPAVHAALIRLQQSGPHAKPSGGARKAVGEVVDLGGRPVAGARVAVASVLFADSVGIGLPAFVINDYLPDDLQFTTSDASGHFVIEDAPPTGTIAAELVDRRSRPAVLAEHVKLVLEPTRGVSGKVDFGNTWYTRVRITGTAVEAHNGKFALVAPVAPDGSFAIGRAMTGALQINMTIPDVSNAPVEFQTVPASPKPFTGIRLGLAGSTRSLDVIVRSAVATPLGGAVIALLAGRQRVTNFDDLLRSPTTGSGFARPITEDGAPTSVRDRFRPGDLVAHFEHVRPGDLTVCAVNFSGDWLDSAFRQRWQAHVPQIPFKCEYIGPSTPSVVLEVPPQQRFDE
jgi:predicted Ser/Thr protein kinase